MNDKQKKFLSDFDKLHKTLTGKCAKGDASYNSLGFMNFMKAVHDCKLFDENDIKFLKLCKDIRNIIAHNSDLDGAIESVSKVNENLQKILDLAESRASSIAVKPVYKAKLGDELAPHVKKMLANLYTHVPVLNESGAVVGTLTENSLVKYMFEQNKVVYPKTITVDILHKVNEHTDEKILFRCADSSIVEIYKIFEVYERTGAVFLTTTGDYEGDILGVITPADLNFKEEG